MSLNTKLSTAVVEAQAEALATLCNGGTLKIYSGTQPADANTAPGGDTSLLVSCALGDPAFASVTFGTMTANAITNGVAEAAGTASWFRIYKADGTTPLLDGSVGTTASNLILTSTNITIGLTVEITSFIHNVLKVRTGL
jgi:hypothetical protein